MSVTLLSFKKTNFNYPDGDYLARFFPTNDFASDAGDGEWIDAGSIDECKNFFSFGANALSNVLTVEDSLLPVPADGKPRARYTLAIFNAAGTEKLETIFEDYELPTTYGSSLTIVQLRAFRESPLPVQPRNIQQEIQAAFDELGIGEQSGSSDLSSDTSSSVDGEMSVFKGTSGKLLRRFTLSGFLKSANGVISALTASGFKTDLSLNLVDNTPDLNKPISAAVQSALDGKAATAHTHTGVYEPANANLQTHIASTANPHGVNKSQVGLANVDNTSDANKPISTAAQTALNAKADLVGGKVPTSQIPAVSIGESFSVASQAAMLALTAQLGDVAIRTDESNGKYLLLGTDPTVLSNWKSMETAGGGVTSVNAQTGTVVLGKADIGLANVDNTSDASKPVSTAQATAINDAKARGNHTGTQLAATISDFNAAALLAAPAETTTTAGSLINGATAKTTPVDADFLGLMDSAAANVLKKLSWANVKATLKAYFDTLYCLLLVTYNQQSGTSYTVQASDLGKIIVCTNASAITVTVPNSLGANFNCAVRQGGAGQVTIAAGSGVTINNADSQTKTAKQHASVTLDTSNGTTYTLSGYTGA